MADEQNQDPVMSPEAAAAAQAGSAQFQIQKLYTKDVSFELPNAPQIFQQEGQADVKMSLSQRVEALGNNLHEVVLTVEEGGIGGFGSHVATWLAGNALLDGQLKFRPLMIPDRFDEHSTQASMYKAAGLDAQGIAGAALQAIGNSPA